MSAATSPPSWWASLVGPTLPPVPEGWTRVRPGRPLLEHRQKDKLRLQWCPLCGPGTEFRIDTDGGKVWGSAEVDEHIAEHRPAQFGLTPLRNGDLSLDEFWGTDE